MGKITFIGLFLAFFVFGCKDDSVSGPSVVGPVSLPPVEVDVAIQFPEQDPLAPIRLGRTHRQSNREQTGVAESDSVHQKDSVLTLVACPDGEKRIALEVGNMDKPYLTGTALVELAKRLAEKALLLPLEGDLAVCSPFEASYWVRDEKGAGDFVIRYPASATKTWSALFVPDVGEPSAVKVVDIPPRVFAGQMLRVAHYLGEYRNDVQSALVLVDKALSIAPDNTDALALYVEWGVDLNPTLVLERIQAFEGANGISEETELLRAKGLLERGRDGDEEAGDALLMELLKKNPENREGRFIFAGRLCEKGDRGRAIAAYLALLKDHPGLSIVHCNLGDLFVLEGEMEKALIELNLCLEADKEDTGALLQRARLFIQQGNDESARTDLKELKRLLPHDSGVLELERQVTR